MGNVIIVMGVAGAGKTTVGTLLAKELHWAFADADDYHSVQNKEKMSKGVPLTDDDRASWLADIRTDISTWILTEENSVLACSALKQSHRDVLQVDGVQFVYLAISPQLARQRLEKRVHFFHKDLISSQFETLEEPTNAVVISANLPPKEIVETIRRHLHV